MRSGLLVAVAACALASSFAVDTRAETRRGASVAAIAGFGTEIRTLLQDGVNSYRWALGIRGGYTVKALPVYIGGSVIHHLGTIVASEGPGNSYTSEHYHTLIGPEVGYDFALTSLITLRPYVGVGLLRFRAVTTLQGNVIDESKLSMYVVPGLLAIMHFGAIFYGPEIRLVMPVGERPDHFALVAQLTLGASF